MSRPQSPIVCDGPGCGKTKQEANHWWQAAVPKDPSVMIEVRLWQNDYPARISKLKAIWRVVDLCGTSCALKFISEQMGKAGEQNAR